MTQKVRWHAVILGLFAISALLTGSIFGAHSFSPTTGQPALYLTADPPAIPAGGVATSTINATVWDGEDWIWDGPIVNFSTDLGDITASAPIENGTATAILTAGYEPGLATVTAVVDVPVIGLLTNTTTVTFEVPIPPLPPTTTPALYLTANPPAIPADGVSTSFINATVWDGENWIWSIPIVNFSTDLGAITESAQIMNGTATATLTAGTTPGVATITAKVTPSEELGLLTNTTTVCFTATDFDTGVGTYPSIAGTYNGTIMPYHPLTVQTLYTYSCEGTGGHTEHVAFYYPNGTLLADASWAGYVNDWRNLSFSAPITLQAYVRYNYTIKTGSYPRQSLHFTKLIVAGGEITCTTFTDVNGRVYYDWIPAIKLIL
jgi:hypothetical protein